MDVAAAFLLQNASHVKLPEHTHTVNPSLPLAAHLLVLSPLLSKLTSKDHKLFHARGLAFSGDAAFSGQSFCGDDDFCRDELGLVGETNLWGEIFAEDLAAAWSGENEAILTMPYPVLSASTLSHSKRGSKRRYQGPRSRFLLTSSASPRCCWPSEAPSTPS